MYAGVAILLALGRECFLCNIASFFAIPHLGLTALIRRDAMARNFEPREQSDAAEILLAAGSVGGLFVPQFPAGREDNACLQLHPRQLPQAAPHAPASHVAGLGYGSRDVPAPAPTVSTFCQVSSCRLCFCAARDILCTCGKGQGDEYSFESTKFI